MKRHGPGRPKLRPRTVVGDRGYTGRPAREYLRRRGISAVVPQFSMEKTPGFLGRLLYRERNVIEHLVGRLKEYRRTAAHYDKLAASYLSPSPSLLQSGCGFEYRAVAPRATLS